MSQEHFFRNDDHLKSWVEKCRFIALHTPPSITTEQLLFNIQAMMDEMQVSHFQIYSPVDEKRMWKGESIDTGIRSRFVEDHLVVYKVFKGSAAEESEIHLGDEIVQIEGAEQLTPWGAQHRSGVFQIKRGKLTKGVSIKARDFVVESSPQLIKLDAHTALVEISSFRSEFFVKKDWKNFVKGLNGYSHVVLDLRENPGGNFVAMLRALSTFLCRGKNAGTLAQPRQTKASSSVLLDNPSDEYQIAELDTFRDLRLETYGDYGCFEGKVTVLIGPDTSSVAEIFAHSFLSRPNSRVWGQPTAGDVVLAVWYDVPLLGSGFSISIPEAVYFTPSKKELEGHGVEPQRELYYDLKLALAGKDTWVVKALKAH